jgi:hypothetical protein
MLIKLTTNLRPSCRLPLALSPTGDLHARLPILHRQDSDEHAGVEGRASAPLDPRAFFHLRAGQVVAEPGRVSARVATAESAVGEIEVSDHLQNAADPREHEFQRDPVQVVDE